MKSFARLLVTAGFVLSVSPAITARAEEPPAPVPDATPAPVPEPTPVPAAAVTDPQIAQIFLVANNGEIQAARSARARSRNKSVLDFAQMMITDHGAARLQGVRLFRSLDMIPLDSTISRGLQKSTSQQLLNLRRLRSVDFDKGYISYQVKAHQDALDLFTRVLLPSVKNPKVKALLESTQPVIERHLKLAQDIQRGLTE